MIIDGKRIKHYLENAKKIIEFFDRSNFWIVQPWQRQSKPLWCCTVVIPNWRLRVMSMNHLSFGKRMDHHYLHDSQIGWQRHQYLQHITFGLWFWCMCSFWRTRRCLGWSMPIVARIGQNILDESSFPILLKGLQCDYNTNTLQAQYLECQLTFSLPLLFILYLFLILLVTWNASRFASFIVVKLFILCCFYYPFLILLALSRRGSRGTEQQNAGERT